MPDTERYCEIGDCNNTADKAHLVTRATLPKSDWDNPIFYMWMCRRHHTEQHKIGVLTFCKKYGLMYRLEKANRYIVDRRKGDKVQ